MNLQFNWGELLAWIKTPLDGFANTLLIILPSAFFVRTIFDVVVHFTKDEQERQQSPLGKRIKGNLGWLLFGFSISIILKVLGIAI